MRTTKATLLLFRNAGFGWIILSLLTPIGCDESNSSPKRSAASMTIEHGLASINKGHVVSEDDVTVVRFRYLLGSLEKKTTNSQQEIANISVSGQKLLRDKYGKDVGLLELMEAANKSIPQEVSLDYTEVVAALIQFMKD